MGGNVEELRSTEVFPEKRGQNVIYFGCEITVRNAGILRVPIGGKCVSLPRGKWGK